jgi:hypothetical protein
MAGGLCVHLGGAGDVVQGIHSFIHVTTVT